MESGKGRGGSSDISDEPNRPRSDSACSVDSYLNVIKRKREHQLDHASEGGADVESAFNRSKKTARSPLNRPSCSVAYCGDTTPDGDGQPAHHDTNDEGTNRIAAIMSQVLGELQVIRKQNDRFQAEILELRKDSTENKQCVQELKRAINEKETAWMEEREVLKAEIVSLDNRLEAFERRERRNNVIIKGIGMEEERGSVADMKKWMREKINVEVDPKSVSPIGRDMILVELDNWEQKQEILRKRTALKGTRFYINPDLTKKERVIQKKIRDAAKSARQKGSNVKIGHLKLRINGTWFEWDYEESKLVEKK